MSLVASYAKAKDGLYYEGPWSGPGWFICLDDDDPPELVINVELHPELDTKKYTVVRAWIVENIPYFHITNEGYQSGRLFGGGFKRARSWFGHFIDYPPVLEYMKGKGKERWSGSVSGIRCPNAVKGYGDSWTCKCGKCKNGWNW